MLKYALGEAFSIWITMVRVLMSRGRDVPRPVISTGT